ncbi:MAG: VCBS repeat-containing protein [Acidobacteriota bacterium]|nr:VCBS repeat-containing protein [Acidobacteriota bacterium]
MKKSVFLGAAFCCLWTVFSMNASAQALINELVVNPGGTDNSCEYIELIGTPGATLTNLYFASIEGDITSTPGVVTALITINSVTLGSTGLLIITGTVPCGNRVYPPGTIVNQQAILDNAGGALQNGTNSFLLISSPTNPIVLGTDYDANNDGTLELLPAGAVIIDAVAFNDGGAGDITYGGVVLTSAAGTIGAAVRFPGNTTPNSAAAFFGGALFGSNDNTGFSSTVRTANFPASQGGALTPGRPNVANDAVVDRNGDGRTDYVVVRNTGGGPNGQLTWFTKISGGNPSFSRQFGVAGTDGAPGGPGGDIILAGDYDGDLMDDITVFRPSNGTFYILQTATLTIRIDQLGQGGDDPSIVGDYDGDGRDDPAVYREGAQSTWFYRTSPGAFFTAVNWGTTDDFVAPGDYDGDGRADFVVQRVDGTAGRFFRRLSGGDFDSVLFGLSDDFVVPGDYDGDGRTDIAVLRANAGGFYVWDFEPSGTAGTTVVSDIWGMAASDLPTQGDYNGDGRTEYSVFRQTTGTFFNMTVGTRNQFSEQWGMGGDFPVALYNTH